MKISSVINVIDVEATCWDNEKDRKGQPNEIIEIGISEVDLKNPVILKSGHIYIKPKNSTISEFCTNLTGITPELIEKEGVSFGNAVKRLKLLYRTHNRLWISWGDYDKIQLQKDCDRNNLEYNRIFFKRHINFKSVFAILNGLSKELGVSAALNYVDFKFEGTPHSGKDDSYNIARLYVDVLEKFKAGIKQ